MTLRLGCQGHGRTGPSRKGPHLTSAILDRPSTPPSGRTDQGAHSLDRLLCPRPVCQDVPQDPKSTAVHTLPSSHGSRDGSFVWSPDPPGGSGTPRATAKAGSNDHKEDPASSKRVVIISTTLERIRKEKPAWVHLAPPCGSFTRRDGEPSNAKPEGWGPDTDTDKGNRFSCGG